MKPFKFFQKKPERVFSDYMDRMDDYFLGGITSATTETGLINEGWDAHRNNFPPGQCPYTIGTRERELWMRGWSNREDNTSINETYPEYYHTDEFEFVDVSPIRYSPETFVPQKYMMFRCRNTGTIIPGNLIGPEHPMYNFPDII